MKRMFVVLNPMGGHSDPRRVRELLEQYLPDAGWSYEIYETTGDEDLPQVVRDGLERGFDLVVAGGGDGTVSQVVTGLVESGVPMGILPVGTGNALARELDIPLDVEQAVRLLAGEHEMHAIDAIHMDEHYYVLNVGVGISSRTMGDTGRQEKRIFGRIAYIWVGIKVLLGVQPHRFIIRTDHHERHLRASEVAVVNSGGIGQPHFRWGPGVQLDDGHLNLCIVRARTLVDYLKVGWDMLLFREPRGPRIRCRKVEGKVTIRTRRTMRVQADGEIVGQTPAEVEIAPAAVEVVVPRE